MGLLPHSADCFVVSLDRYRFDFAHGHPFDRLLGLLHPARLECLLLNGALASRCEETRLLSEGKVGFLALVFTQSDVLC